MIEQFSTQLTGDYQLSTAGVGAVAIGVEDIRQCIDFILRTIPGSDPLRPLFGCNIFDKLDKPVHVAIPHGKKDIFEALSLWEPRISVERITHQLDKEKVNYFISYRIIDDNILDTISFDGTSIKGGESTGNVILSAVIPTKVPNGIFYPQFKINEVDVLPKPPQSGFENGLNLHQWVSSNWANYGRWYLTDNKLYLYLNNGFAKTAYLNVIQSAIITVKVTLNELGPTGYYNLNFSIDGQLATPEFPQNTIKTPEQLLVWVQNNWSLYGSWVIETNSILVEGDFSDDFSSDFSTGEYKVTRQLVFQSEQFTTVNLTLV